MVKTITILGAGGWGTALAIHLNNRSYKVRLWGRNPEYVSWLRRYRENTKYLPGISISESIKLTSELPEALEETNLMVMAVPAQFCRSVLIHLMGALPKDTPIVSVTKGIENETLMLPSEIIKYTLGRVRVGVLSGPSHSEEVARHLPASVVVSSKDADLMKLLQSVFTGDRLRVYTNPDLVGVEFGGAAKNVVAIASGICEGMALGDNARAALVSRGLVEMARLGTAMGAKKNTFFGLSGLGDLVTTCYSPYGRNREVGFKIGKGTKLSQVLQGMAKVAEGVATAQSIVQLAKKHEVEMPISQEVYRMLYEDKDPAVAVKDLMLRTPKSEVEDLI